MIPKVFREVIDLGDGRTISLETGKLAKQAHGSVVVQMGKAMLLCTVVSNYKQSPHGCWFAKTLWSLASCFDRGAAASRSS